MLRHRIPVRVRHHWKLLAGVVVFLLAVGVLFGTERVRPLVFSDTASADDPVAVDIAGLVDVFDRSQPHTLSITFRDADYRRMLTEFFKDGSKEYLPADLTIDGTFLPEVGIRLKGNSTLRGLQRAGAGGGAGPVRGGGGFMAALSTEEPEKLPWLISIDEYVDGRVYQGREEIAVRPAGMSPTGLNEAVALSLVGLAGEPTQRFAYSSVTVNGRPTVTRLLVEHPDDTYADSLGDNGVLYKSLSTGQFLYRGEDPTSYTQDFDQVNKGGSQDLQPLMELIRWVTQVSNAEFDKDLARHVDVASFARYAALQNLLLNFDDMAGPGRNYYLWYDLDRRVFTVITWDLNFAFSGEPGQGPFEVGRPGGFRPGGPPPVFVGGGGGGGIPRMGHKLKERFLASPTFKKVYEQTYRELYRTIYADGGATRALDDAVASLSATKGVDAAGVTSAADSLRTLIGQRTASLATNPVITGG